MLWINFLLTNLHFVVSLLGFVTCLILVYVFYSSFRMGKSPHLLLRSIGFLALAIYLGGHARTSGELAIESIALQLARFSALGLITLSYYLEPLQKLPSAKQLLVLPFAASLAKILGILSFAASLALVARIYRKYSSGLERELKNLHRGFVLYFLFEFFHALSIFGESRNVLLSRLAADFGFFWIVSHLTLLAAFLYLLKYAWGYLRFEIFSQIFGAFVISSLLIFMVTTVVYTFLLLRQMAVSAQEALKTDLASFNYSISRLRDQGAAVAQALALNEEIGRSLEDQEALQAAIDQSIISSGVDFLVVTDSEGKVLGKADSYQTTGYSLSSNFVVSRALAGESKTNLLTRDWVNAPLALIEVATPSSYGVVYTGYILDSAFVDGYRDATGLETSIYVGSVKSATTFVAADGITRLVGAIQTSPTIKTEVLEKGNNYSGLTSVFANEYLSEYGPFKNEEGKILGMVFVGFPSNTLYAAARTSIYATFYVIIFLVVFSFIPAYFFAKFIEKHQV